MRISVPEIYTWNMDRKKIQDCLNLPKTQQVIEVKYSSENDKFMRQRGTKKFKIYYMHMCYI